MFGSRCSSGGLREREMNTKAYLPGYDHDIFVSYAHEEQLGEWTVRLQDDLRKALNLIFYLKPPGPTFDLWIDEILRKNLPLSGALKAHVEGSALLLIVMSPFYLRSDFCGKEVAWFVTAARSRIDPHARIFVVHAQATNRTAWPASLADLPGYQFFARHPKVNLELPLGLIGDKDDEVAFKQALYNLAGQIKQQIDDLTQEVVGPSSPPTSARPPGPQQAPAVLVCLEVLDVASPGAPSAVEQEVRRVISARNAEIFSPGTLGTPPSDPIGANRHLQKLVKAKAGCDGLVVVRAETTASLDDWLLDYLSEVRPMARRVRMNGGVPLPLLVELSPYASASQTETVPTLRYSDPQFEELLGAWIDSLPTLQKQAA
jgi:hypothetical protein